MLCSIHENYSSAIDTFEIAELVPALTLKQFASSLVDLLTDYSAITEVETATLVMPSEVGQKPKTIDRVMINLNPELKDLRLDYAEVIRSAADTLFMQRASEQV